jgi:tRNA nucleotidyltransferase/poly(A) polymerase
VSPAFAEDPVRILRVARFAARFGFKVAPATLRLMRAMVEAGEADALVPERVWQELAVGLMEAAPSKMFALLRNCGALARVLPELAAAWTSRAPMDVRNGRSISPPPRAMCWRCATPFLPARLRVALRPSANCAR